MVRKKESISIVVPVFNEFGNIKEFHKQLVKTMSRCLAPYEIIYIDDFVGTGNQFEKARNFAQQSVVGTFSEFLLVPSICEEGSPQKTDNKAR